MLKTWIKTLSIALTVFFVFCQCSFAALTKGDAREQQASQDKMAKLQQILTQAAQSNVMPVAPGAPAKPDVTANLLSSATPAQASDLAPTPAQAPSAGVVSAASSIAPSPDANVVANSSPQSGRTVYDEAFSNVVNQLLPMTPNQMAKLREVFNESQKAAATPPGVPPKPTSTSLLVNLAPQAAAPVIRLGAGFITSLVFIDATGQPWPIDSYSVGDSSAFNIMWDRKGNTLLVQSLTFYKSSNLAVILRDLNTPVMLTLISGQTAVDYRVDLRIPGAGPNAVFLHNGIPDAVNPLLFDVLNGVPPKGSKELKVSGGGYSQAWLLDKKLYLRTNLNVVSPAWQAVMSSIDGTHAYQLQPVPVILALQHGKDKILTLTIEGLE